MSRGDRSRKQVGFVGVGQMGRPMVDRLVAAGFPVAAFVRRRDVAESLELAGVAVVATTSELARQSDVLIVCTFSDDQLATVVLGDGARSGRRGGG
jgi:3-hydroxyisobutyrate dehydrogenase-like beta-hydroxyacid dehydrogenase